MVFDFYRWKKNGERPILAVSIHRGQIDLGNDRPLEVGEIRILERGDDLPHAVRAEIEEDQGIAVFDAAAVASRRSQNRNRLHEFIAYALLVETPKRFQRLLRLRSYAESHQIVPALNALPAFVPIHREIAADDRGQMNAWLVGDEREQLVEIALRRLRR